MLKLIVGLTLVAGVSFWFVHSSHEKQAAIAALAVQKRNQEDAKAVATLPESTQEAWDAYVDRRIAAAMHRNGNSIQVEDDLSKMMSKTMVLSVNSPYVISCDPMEGNIKFPEMVTKYGDDSETLTISIYLISIPETGKTELSKTKYMNLDSSAEQPPSLAVSDESIAASNLFKHVCQHITEKVQAVFKPM